MNTELFQYDMLVMGKKDAPCALMIAIFGEDCKLSPEQFIERIDTIRYQKAGMVLFGTSVQVQPIFTN